MEEERERPQDEVPAPEPGQDGPSDGRDEVDEQSEESFPASDPPSYRLPTAGGMRT